MRPAVPGDADFLLEMLVETVNWDPDRPPLSRDDIRSRPDLHHYVAGWPRPTDAGVVREDVEGRPLGAAWYRLFPEDDPGYGFVDATVPEVAIGVVPSRRGQGIGRALLDALHATAREQDLHALSLSVEKANPARRLYERLGYAVAGATADRDNSGASDISGASVTMLVEL